MEKYDFKKEQLKFHNIVIAITSEPDYEMSRYILLEDLKNIKYGEYVIVEGSHCSCYDFDDTEWEAVKYSHEELIKIAKDKIENGWECTEKKFYELVLKYIKGE